MWNKLKEKVITKEFLTFGIIGVFNTLIAQGLYMVFVSNGMLVSMASIFGDLLSMVFSYIMNMRFTYKQKMSFKSAITFPLSYLPGIIISALMTVLFVHGFHVDKMWAKLVALPIYVPLNFLCMNKIVNHFGGGSMKKEA